MRPIIKLSSLINIVISLLVGPFMGFMFSIPIAIILFALTGSIGAMLVTFIISLVVLVIIFTGGMLFVLRSND